MTKHLLLAGIIVLVIGTMVLAGETPPSADNDKDATKATFLIAGLHCPPCTRTVETSLSQAEGVHSIKVDWKTKKAQMEFDESVVSAQKIAQLVAATPHMMGGNMHYSGWLSLKIPGMKDAATGTKVKQILAKLKGVKTVAVYPAKHSAIIVFAAKGNLTSAQLIEALNQAGIEAENM